MENQLLTLVPANDNFMPVYNSCISNVLSSFQVDVCLCRELDSNLFHTVFIPDELLKNVPIYILNGQCLDYRTMIYYDGVLPVKILGMDDECECLFRSRAKSTREKGKYKYNCKGFIYKKSRKEEIKDFLKEWYDDVF